MSELTEVQEVSILSMIIGVDCPHCQTRLVRGLDALGTTTLCRKCDNRFAVPNGIIVYGRNSVQPATPEGAAQLLADTAPDSAVVSDRPKACPHADPFVYCAKCEVSPCPIGLGEKGTLQ